MLSQEKPRNFQPSQLQLQSKMVQNDGGDVVEEQEEEEEEHGEFLGRA